MPEPALTKLGGNTSGISALVLIARRSECATHSANLSKILLLNSCLKLGKKSAKSQAMERNGPAERENGLFRREQFPSLSRKRPQSLALKLNVCKLEKGVGKPTGAAVGSGVQPSLAFVRRVSRAESPSGVLGYAVEVHVAALVCMSCCLGTGSKAGLSSQPLPD